MKKTLSIFFLMLFAASAVIAHQRENPQPSPNVGLMKIGNTFRLYYKAETSADVRVSIYNASRKLVYWETIRDVDGFSRPYNFDGLPEGKYTIEVSGKGVHAVANVVHGEAKVQRQAVVKRIEGEPNKFIVSVPNKQPDVLSIKIYGDNDRVVYEETAEVTSDFAKVYNLQQFTGKFSFEIIDKKGNFKIVQY